MVEDHDFQRTAVQLLRGLGVGEVRDAGSGAEALALLQEGGVPDVIICDIDMPQMDGVEFVSRVAASNLACAIVIASGLETNVLRAVEAIGEGHGLHVLAALEKPLTARRLGDVLRQYTRPTPERAHLNSGVDLNAERLRSALERHELTARFAPRIDFTTGAIGSAEAIGHWEGPDGVSVPASAFLAGLAREGILLDLVERLVTTSCTLMDEMRAAGLDEESRMRVAVNVSRLPLADVSLASRLTEMVRGGGHEPRRFVWELDDVALARAPAPALELLTRLRVKGFRLAIRHSGTGPLWTQQVGRIPLSEIKLDRRLVSGATGDAKRFTVLEAVFASAREARLAVVADGCDSSADFETLLALGCAEAQGEYLAPAMPAASLVSWARAGPAPEGVR